jgi:micrococcal nuclease
MSSTAARRRQRFPRPSRVVVIPSTILLLLAACSPAVVAPPAPPSEPTLEATASPTPTAEPTPLATPRPTPSPTPRPTPAATPTPTPAPTPAPTPIFGAEPTGPTQVGTVTRVIDGDTVEVDLSGQLVRIRYIGIDTPETQSGVEWMGPEATEVNRQLVEGRQVTLEKDVSETDQYGRLLRYVWVGGSAGWLLVNLELLRLGYAQVTTYPPDVKYVDALYLNAERAAREAGIGLWGVPPTPVPTPVPPPPPPVYVEPAPPPPVYVEPAPAPVAACDPSYPTLCLTIGAPDLDCPDVGVRRFPVYPPDPHGFDGDADGIGCE